MNDRTVATPEEIAMFKAGAAARYAERGIPADKAEALFEAHMSKTAEALGYKPTAGAVKLAASIRQAMNPVKK